MAARKHVPGQLGLFTPISDWQRPTELPDLRNRKTVALDTETRDLGFEANKGPGWAFGRQMVWLCGVSWSTEGSTGYAPTRHPDTDCFPVENVVRWIDDHAKAGVTFVLHNSGYDLGTLGTYGAQPLPNIQDTLAAAVMLNENAHGYSLDACCARAKVPGKDTALLKDAVRAYGGNPAKPQADLWRLPARYAGPYAEADGVATLALWGQQEGQLRAQEVWDAYRTEIDLVPMVVAMRRKGIRIDVDRAVQTGKMFRARAQRALEYVADKIAVGRALKIDDLRSPQFLERLFTAENIPFPRTAIAKQGSFSKDWMERSEHWLPRAIVQARQAEEAANKFIDNYLMSFIHRGRIHAEVHQFRSDEGGTKSHRFSYSEPPLQQMPTPDKDKRDGEGLVIPDSALGQPIRQLFLPEEGQVWAAPDFSSQEPRLTVHFAALCKCAGADKIVQEYLDNPRTDYHGVVAKMVNMPRPRAKILNLAMTYGKGRASLAEELGLSLMEADAVLTQYHERLPYVKALEDTCKKVASTRGYIRLIDGARMRYEDWEGPFISGEERDMALRAGHKMTPCSIEDARERQEIEGHPWAGKRLRRADTRKSLNNLVQGSAARQTKIAMLRMWQAGYTPLIQMHDEVCVSITTEAQLTELTDIMVNAVQLKVPVVVDAEVGVNWGEAKNTWAQYVTKYGEPSGARPQ